MKTKLQVIIATGLVIASTVGISGKSMIDVPFLNDSLCLWVHYIICAFSGLFGLIWLYFVANQNDSLIRFKKDYYLARDEVLKMSAKNKKLTESIDFLRRENEILEEKLTESESDKAILSDCSDMLHKEYMILKQKYFSAQGNMAQLRSKLKYYKSLKINK